MKFLLSISILFLGSFFNLLFAQTTGKGCNLGNSVATQFLGTATYNGHSDQFVRVYSSSSATIVPIINGNGYAGYRCGYINIYPSGSRYVAATNSNVSYSAANEITATYSSRCATAASLPANYVSNSGGAESNEEVDYRYNDPAYYADADPNYPCASQPNNLPIDDYTSILVVSISITGFLCVRKRAII
ncbi:hypothetical protein [Pedobacter sp. KACC 23697]|uniref:Secreted protein n=1 Tax=Pedobacter sp. KACC 23697 TaxID=3149230 RepID=A0AAU7K7R5_9SPHI